MNRRLTVPLPLALVLASITPFGFALMQGQAPKPATVAVVDLKKVFDSDSALKEDMEAINKRAKEEEEKLKKMREGYTALRLEFEQQTDQLSEKYVAAGAAMFAKEEEIKRTKVGTEQWLNREASHRNLKALERYKLVIGQYAAKRGLDIVLRMTEPEDKERSLESRLQAAELGVVLYRNDNLDITKDIIDLLKAK